MNNLLQAAQHYVKQCFETYLPEGFYYHNWEHTLGVVRLCTKMTADQPEAQQEILRLAAWFHDLGYLSSLEQHEAHSITWWRAYAASLRLSTSLVEQVVRCIEATKLGSIPADELAAQLADADLAYSVADGYFEERGNALRKEWAVLFKRSYTDDDWYALQQAFLQDIRFKSAYGKSHFAPQLEQTRLRFAKSGMKD